MTQRDNHEVRTDLYEKSKAKSAGMQQLDDLMGENYKLQEFNAYGRSTDAPGKERDLSAPRWYDAHPLGPDVRGSHMHQGLVELGGDIGSHKPGELTKLRAEMMKDPNHPAHAGLNEGLVQSANMLHSAYKKMVGQSGAKLA